MGKGIVRTGDNGGCGDGDCNDDEGLTSYYDSVGDGRGGGADGGVVRTVVTAQVVKEGCSW